MGCFSFATQLRNTEFGDGVGLRDGECMSDEEGCVHDACLVVKVSNGCHAEILFF